jgi:hypothetical protein
MGVMVSGSPLACGAGPDEGQEKKKDQGRALDGSEQHRVPRCVPDSIPRSEKLRHAGQRFNPWRSPKILWTSWRRTPPKPPSMW